MRITVHINAIRCSFNLRLYVHISCDYATDRADRARSCLSRSGMLCMMFKLGQCAQQNWRRLRGFKDLGKIIEEVKFKDGLEVNQQTDQVTA